MMFVWTVWLQLHSARGSNGMGPNPITFTEIAAWSHLLTPLDPWEVEAVRMVDDAYISTYFEEAK